MPYPFRLVYILLSLSLFSAPRIWAAPGLSQTEKLEARLRDAIVKATKGVHARLIKAAQLQALLEDTNLVLIDVRQPEEQTVSMLPHALTTAEFAQTFRHGI